MHVCVHAHCLHQFLWILYGQMDCGRTQKYLDKTHKWGEYTITTEKWLHINNFPVRQQHLAFQIQKLTLSESWKPRCQGIVCMWLNQTQQLLAACTNTCPTNTVTVQYLAPNCRQSHWTLRKSDANLLHARLRWGLLTSRAVLLVASLRMLKLEIANDPSLACH